MHHREILLRFYTARKECFQQTSGGVPILIGQVHWPWVMKISSCASNGGWETFSLRGDPWAPTLYGVLIRLVTGIICAVVQGVVPENYCHALQVLLWCQLGNIADGFAYAYGLFKRLIPSLRHTSSDIQRTS